MPALNSYTSFIVPPASVAMCACSTRRPMSVRLGLRSGTRPVFEGRWSCRTACLEAAVMAAVRREWTRNSGAQKYHHRVPLGLMLLSKGVVTREQLQSALALQQKEGGRIGDILIRHCGADEQDITAALSAQWNCPVWAIRSFDPARMARLAPREIFVDTGMVPLRNVGGERLYIAFTSAVDAGAALALERIHGISVECGIAAESEMQTAQERLAAATYIRTEYEPYTNESDLAERLARLLARLEPVEARLVRVGGQFWLRTWLEPGALTASLSSEDVCDYLFTTTGGTA